MLILGQSVDAVYIKPKRENRADRRARQGKGRRIGLGAREVAARKRWLRGSDEDGRRNPVETPDGHPHTFVPSEPWLDALFPTFEDVSPDGEPITYYFHSAGGSPRNPVPSGFVRCKGCGHNNPPQCVGSSGHCDDCRFGAMTAAQIAGLPGSTSSIDIKRLRAARRVNGVPYTGGL